MKRIILAGLRIATLTVAGTAGAIVLGLLAYGTAVFDPVSAGFSFVSFGFSTSLIFAFYHERGLSDTVTAAVVVSAVQFVAASAYVAILRAVLFSFGLNVPVVVLAFLFERKLAAMRTFRFVFVAMTFGGMFVLLTLLVDVLSGAEGLPPAVFQHNFIDGVMLGLGVGLGVAAGEALLASLEHHAQERRARHG
jgi:thiamine transporter ThiT